MPSSISRGGTAAQVRTALRRLADPAKAVFLKRFFKTGPGEYAEGDVLIGVTVPKTRTVVRAFADLPRGEVLKLLKSKVHEERLAALLIMDTQFARAAKRGDGRACDQLYRDYLAHTAYINNWDLVDSSAPYIVGEYLRERGRQPLYKLARSKMLWERRIAMIACAAFIRKGETKDGLAIATILLHDEHDLIQKAVGWMLREIGQQDKPTLVHFLDKHAHHMPRTMLRYSIEKFSPSVRKQYLNAVHRHDAKQAD